MDFETYYSKEYGLGKLTTEEYVRSPMFEVIGVSVKVNDYPAEWFSGDMEATWAFLAQYEWGEAVAVAHNAMFDMAIMNWVFGIRPHKIVDTLSMARGLGLSSTVGGSLKSLAQHYGVGKKGTEVLDALGKRREDFTSEDLAQYGEYCKNDVELTYELFKILAQGFPVSELQLIDNTIRMFSEPVLELDTDILTESLHNIQMDKLELLDRVPVSKEDLMSNDKFAEALRSQGVVPPTKISPRTGKEAYAFAKSDEAFKALQAHENPVVQALVAARLGHKSTIEETRTQRFIDIACRGRLPVPLTYYAAHTGRWGGSDSVNLQNIPRTSAIKYAMCAPDGHCIVDSDLSQIEARTLAWLAEQEDLLEAFENGEDVYKIMASAIYGKPVEDITKPERFVGKTTILGCGYGMGAEKFQAQLKVFNVELPADECQRIIRVYRQTYPRIPQLWKQANKALVAVMTNRSAPLGRAGVLEVEGEKGIRLPNGFYLRYPGLRDDGDNMVYDTRLGKRVVPNKIYGGKVVENVCQALARIVIGEQINRVSKKYKVALTVHDAIGCIVPEGEKETGKEFVEMVMRIRPKWAPDLPLDCEAGVGKSYGGCK